MVFLRLGGVLAVRKVDMADAFGVVATGEKLKDESLLQRRQRQRAGARAVETYLCRLGRAAEALDERLKAQDTLSNFGYAWLVAESLIEVERLLIRF